MNYIIGVAQHNPYEEQRTEYERLHSASRVPSVPSAVPSAVPAASTTPSVSSYRSPSSEILNVLYSSPIQNEMILGSSYGSRRRSIFQSQHVDPIMTLLGSLIGDTSVGIGTSSVGIREPSSVGIGSTGPYSSINMQAFLNERIIVNPSPEQIDAGTILTTALHTQDDNCSICQDPIEQNQSMRIIRHCTHRFHQDCIDTWFQQHVSCPTCRHDIRE